MNNSNQSQQQQQRDEQQQQLKKKKKMKMVPLSKVVSDCTRRWFQDTLKEAQAGDSAMQLLVGQMYNGGYGTPQNPNEGRAWIHKASSSTSAVCGEQPGYNGSKSDSDDTKA